MRLSDRRVPCVLCKPGDGETPKGTAARPWFERFVPAIRGAWTILSPLIRRRRSGDLWIGLAAEAIEADDAFGGLAGGLLAYRLDARAQIATLGFNYALSRKLSADLQGQYITTRADARNEYERTVAVVSLLARF
jgi:hypothetical protein